MAASAQEPAPSGCELHVWPSAGLSQVRQHGREPDPRRSAGLIDGLIDAEIARRNAVKDQRASANLAEAPAPMAPADQATILKSAPLADALGLSGYSIIVHDQPLDTRTIRTKTTRYADSDARCYADLVISDIVYARVYAHGRKLKAFVRFRDFGTDGAPVASFGTWVETDLKLFSIDPPDTSPAALDDLAAAYRQDLAAFGTALKANRDAKPVHS